MKKNVSPYGKGSDPEQNGLLNYKPDKMLFRIIILLAVFPLITSCDSISVSTPQPVDSKNIMNFPRDYRGTWTCEGNTVTIGKDFYEYSEVFDVKIPKQLVDTSSSYLLKNNKIYYVDRWKQELGEGFPYTMENDTIYYTERTVSETTLGQNAFLRRVKKNYILNVKQENQWWQLALIEKNKGGEIIIRIQNLEELDRFSNHTHIHTLSGKYDRSEFIEANWTRKDLSDMLNKGMFSDTLLVLEPNNKIRCDDF